jgi:hypothetical protein
MHTHTHITIHSLHLFLCRPREDLADPKERQAAEEAANKESQRKAMARVTKQSAEVRGLEKERRRRHRRGAFCWHCFGCAWPGRPALSCWPPPRLPGTCSAARPPVLPAPPNLASCQAGDAHFEAAYKLIQEAVAHMSAEESAKEIKQMKPTVSDGGARWLLIYYQMNELERTWAALLSVACLALGLQ